MESTNQELDDDSPQRSNDDPSDPSTKTPARQIEQQNQQQEEEQQHYQIRRDGKTATVLLLCGLPGSGKSTIASLIMNVYTSGVQTHSDNNDNAHNCSKQPSKQDGSCNINKDEKKNLETQQRHYVESLQWYDRAVFIDYDKIAQGLLSSSSSNSHEQHKDNINDSKESKEKNYISPHSKSFVFSETDLESWRKTRSVAIQAVESELHRFFFCNGSDEDGKKEENAVAGVVVQERRKEKCNNPTNKTTDLLEESERMLILLDDNFHLRSMRRDIYRICKSCAGDLSKDDTITNIPTKECREQEGIVCKQEQQQQSSFSAGTNSTLPKNDDHYETKNDKISFGIVVVDASLEVCLRRNKFRTGIDCIPENVVVKMSETFEPPDPEKAKFESSFVTVYSSSLSFSHLNSDKEDTQKKKEEEESALGAISTCIHHARKNPISPPPPPFDEEAEQKRRNKERNITLASRVHRYDRLLRLLVGASCRVMDKSYARHINEVRRILLGKIKNGTLYGEDGTLDDSDEKVLKERYNIQIESNIQKEDKEEAAEGVVVINNIDDAAVIRRFMMLVLGKDEKTDNSSNNKNSTAPSALMQNETTNGFSTLLEGIQRSYEKFNQSYQDSANKS